MSVQAAGYSGTPLAKKLGITEGCRVLLIDAPADYRDLFESWPPGVQLCTGTLTAQRLAKIDLVHLFVTEQARLADTLLRLRAALPVQTPVWVSWPKKASKVPTTVTEDSIRAAALPLDFVDIKVCAVSAVWSGLKLVVRKSAR